MLPDLVFVHGYTASSQSDWYPAISPELIALGVQFAIPDLPGGDFPQADEWVRHIGEAVTRSRQPVVLVGHSLGTRAVLLFLEKSGVSVDAVFLIAAFNNSVDNARRAEGRYASFFHHHLDLQQIRRQSKKWVVIHSTDDDSIPFAQGKQVADELRARLISPSRYGHFCDSSEAAFILSTIRSELSF